MSRKYPDQADVNRGKPRSILWVLSLVPLLVGMTAANFGQDTSYWTPPEYHHPADRMSLHELAQRYGITETVQMYFKLQREEEALRDAEKVQEALRRDQELREKVVQLATTSLRLYQRFNNPSVIHADTPELARRCEKLAKDIKKLLR